WLLSAFSIINAICSSVASRGAPRFEFVVQTRNATPLIACPPQRHSRATEANALRHGAVCPRPCTDSTELGASAPQADFASALSTPSVCVHLAQLSVSFQHVPSL